MSTQYTAVVTLTPTVGDPVRVASVETYRDGNWYDGNLLAIPEPTESTPEEYGVIDEPGLSLELSYDPLYLGETELDALIGGTAEIILIDGAVERTIKRSIGGYTVEPGSVSIDLPGIKYDDLKAPYPAVVYTADDWPEQQPEGEGRPIQDVVGLAYRVPCVMIEHGAQSGPWVYSIGIRKGGDAFINAVYRNGMYIGSDDGLGNIKDGGDTIATISTRAGAVSGAVVDVIVFAEEQVDFSGAWYVIEADVTQYDAVNAKNAATELGRILTQAGFTPSAASIAAAESIATANDMEYHHCYGRDAQQGLQGPVEELLAILRAGMYRNAAGEIELVQDVAGTAVASYDESFRDPVTVASFSRDRRPAAVHVAHTYRPLFAGDGGDLRFQAVASVTGGSGPIEKGVLAGCTTHAQADRHAQYLAARHIYNGRVSLSVQGEDQDLSLGDIVGLTQPALWTGEKEFRIRRITREVGWQEIEAVEYADAAYNYTPTSAPTGATGYTPDFSQTGATEPGIPSVFAQDSIMSDDGTATAQYEVRAAWPAGSNWETVYCIAVDDGNNTQTAVQRMADHPTDPGVTDAVAFIGGLTPGRQYHILAWAINQWGKESTTQTTVASTLALGDTAAPAIPTGVVAVTGTGKSADVTWTAVADFDLAEYQVQRKKNAGSFQSVYQGRLTAYHDADITYNNTYEYKVRAVDLSGNASAYSTSDSVQILTNIGDSDIKGSDPIRDANIDSVNADKIDAGTITGSTIRTSAGSSRVEAKASTNTLHIYQGGVESGTFGVGSYINLNFGTYDPVLVAGHSTYTDSAIVALNYSNVKPTLIAENQDPNPNSYAAVFASGGGSSKALKAAGPMEVADPSGFNGIKISSEVRFLAKSNRQIVFTFSSGGVIRLWVNNDGSLGVESQ